MAATSKKGKKQKGKTLNLTEFLSANASSTADGKAVVTLKSNSWADEVEDNEDDYMATPETISLPTAPRASRQEIDLTKFPDKPPFTVYVGNLSYDVDEESLSEYFTNKFNISVQQARLVRENGRMKGYGYVEFKDKTSLVEAFKADGEMLMNRKLKVDIATQSGNRERDGGGFGGDRGGSQITGLGDADDDWRTSASKTTFDSSSSYGKVI